MTNLKKMIKIFIIALTIGVTAASCQENYKELDDGLYAEFQTTQGTMVAKLYFEKAPVTVANFVALAEGKHPKVADTFKGKPFYDGIMFHRVIDQFMIQAGDHTGTGSGNPGYRFHSEFNEALKHSKPGILSMANSGGLDTNGTQFFITEKVSPSTTNLNAFLPDGTLKNCAQRGVSCHAVFGEIVIGMAVHDSISNTPVQSGSNKPLTDVVINKLNIIRKGKKAKAFDAPKIFSEGEPKLAEGYKALNEKQLEMQKEKSKLAAANFKEANKELKGDVFESPTGMIMIKTKNANGVTPKESDKVNVNCAGYFEDGTLFYTTWQEVAKANGKFDEQAAKQNMYKPFVQPYNSRASLIPGFREAFLKMNIGDKAKVFIPSYLGYGAVQNGPIPANSNLVFDIEIVNIKK